MNQGIQRPSYDEIKDYIKQELKFSGEKNSPIVSFNSLTREVFVRAYNQNFDEVRRVYEIPNPKEDAASFKEIWIDIFMGCLDYYRKKLRKEGATILEYEN